jgi:hypothetical protein
LCDEDCADVTKLSTGDAQFFQESDLDRLIDVGPITKRNKPRLISLFAVLSHFYL